MNKLYLLAALGLAVKADTGLGEDSNGWYAGDCLDPESYSSSYGYVSYDCGDDCSADGGDDNGTDEVWDSATYEAEYPDCFGDELTDD